MKILKTLLFTLLISSASAGEKVNIIGNVVYSKTLNAFSVVYLKDDRFVSHFIQVKNQNELRKLKSLIGKSIRIEGDLNWNRSNHELFSLKEELTITKISNFELNSLALDVSASLAQDKILSREKKFKRYQLTTSFTVSNATADTLIASSAVALGVVGGPVVLAPVAIFGISHLIRN